MHYLDKREAKVKICHALAEKGWEIYGYDPDQSDSMTDYYHPASWDGIATKNGYVLVIDNSNTYYSGYQLKKYNYNSKKVIANERIEKLTAMMNDPASTENEKASCATLIQKEQEKTRLEPEYTILSTYPTFTHGNPKNACWHIEKDGQIIAKGNGAFAVNSYNWEDKTKTAEEQKTEKLASFINRIEKALSDADALQAEVVKVPKSVIRPVEKGDKTINKGDILSFSYHGHYWIVLDVYTFGEQVHVTYELLGSEKRGYRRVNNSKRYYQPLTRLQKEMNEGKVKVYTLQEVTEYQEKTIFKKTKRKQTIVDAPAIETSQEFKNEEYTNENEEKEEQTNGETNTYKNEQTNNEVTLKINSEKNGIEIKFNHKPSQSIIDGLKENGFRWSSYNSVWWAKQTPDRLKFATMFIEAFNSISQEEPEAKVSETVYGTQETTNENNTEATEQYNVIFHNFGKVETQEEGPQASMFDDILSKFDNVEVTTEQKVPIEDLDFCKNEQELYNAAINVFINIANEIKNASGLNVLTGEWYKEKSSNTYLDSYRLREIKVIAMSIKESFIDNIVSYFTDKYNVTIKKDRILKNFDYDITYTNIIDDIMTQLDGFSFAEKAVKELLDKTKNTYYYNEYRKHSNMDIKNNKIVIDGSYTYKDTIWNEYRLRGGFDQIFTALYLFDNGSIPRESTELHNRYCGDQNERNERNYEKYRPNSLTTVESIKFFKNGKLEIEFKCNQMATKFAYEYLGYKKVSA